MISAEQVSSLGSGHAKLLIVEIEASLKDACSVAPMEQKSSLVERLPEVFTVWITIEGCMLGTSEGDSEAVTVGWLDSDGTLLIVMLG